MRRDTMDRDATEKTRNQFTCFCSLTFLVSDEGSLPEDYKNSDDYTGAGLEGELYGFSTGLFSLDYHKAVVGTTKDEIVVAIKGTDGFMDSMDGLLSARTPERMLEIMKDSHVGAFGALSTMAFLLLKFAFLVELLSHSSPLAPLVLLFMPFVARWLFLIGIFFFPYARKEGLGKGFHESSREKKGIFFGQGILLLALTYFVLHWAGVAGFILATVFLVIFTRKVSRLLGGLTGDLYGASIEIGELLFLLGCYPLLGSFPFLA